MSNPLDVSTRSLPENEVLEAVPVATYRVLDERSVPRLPDRPPLSPGAGFKTAVLVSVAWLFARAVGFVQMIAGFLLALVMIGCLLAAALYLAFGFFTGVHRWELFGIWLGFAFAAFCLNMVLALITVWAENLPGRILRRHRG